MEKSTTKLLENLLWVYHTIVASENLLAFAAARSSGSRRDYFKRHLEEERGHAQWLAEDLHSAGLIVSRTKIPQPVVEMVGSIYYFVLHVNPIALLGYMRVLEMQPLADLTARLEGLESSPLLRTVRLHAQEDPWHAEEIQRMIDACTLPERRLIDQTAALTRRYLQRWPKGVPAQGVR